MESIEKNVKMFACVLWTVMLRSAVGGTGATTGRTGTKRTTNMNGNKNKNQLNYIQQKILFISASGCRTKQNKKNWSPPIQNTHFCLAYIDSIFVTQPAIPSYIFGNVQHRLIT
jgi:hypothetical protein